MLRHKNKTAKAVQLAIFPEMTVEYCKLEKIYKQFKKRREIE